LGSSNAIRSQYCDASTYYPSSGKGRAYSGCLGTDAQAHKEVMSGFDFASVLSRPCTLRADEEEKGKLCKRRSELSARALTKAPHGAMYSPTALSLLELLLGGLQLGWLPLANHRILASVTSQVELYAKTLQKYRYTCRVALHSRARLLGIVN
jgi:hypothetical protein